jgi:hypothetical protein
MAGGVRRLAVRLFFASVAVNAAFAIAVLLAGDFGETEGKILFTSLSVSGASLLALACAAGRGRGRLGAAPSVGAVGAVVGFTVLVVAVWAEPEATWPGQIVGTLLTPSVAIALISLASLATLAPRFRWVFTAVAALTALLAAMLLSAIWGEWEDEWFWRLFGAVAVGLAAFAVVIPALVRISRSELAAAAPGGGRVAYCPSCGGPVAAEPEAGTACPACGARFVVMFR